MTVFADSSALVKLYVDEVDHERVRAVADDLVISQIARVEVPASFWGKHRAGELSPADAALLTEQFEFDYSGSEASPPRFAVVALTVEVLESAAANAAVHGLRAYDAVQLSCALAARDALDGPVRAAVFDTALERAFAATGFRSALR